MASASDMAADLAADLNLDSQFDSAVDATPSCSDHMRNGGETDIDCGGSCAKCNLGQQCQSSHDCQSGACGSSDLGMVCLASTCSDTVKNGNETDIDCGGNCGKCGSNKSCVSASDCQSGICATVDMGKACAPPTCSDFVRNLDESDIDCGGSCSKCLLNKACSSGSDCASTFCYRNLCVTSCHDGVKDFNETDVDCGGAGCSKCGEKNMCSGNSDCQSLSCVGGLCTDPGLIGWWRFDEGAGLTANDSSGFSNNGSLTGTGSSYTTGFSLNALSMNGAGAVDITNVAPLNSLATITIEAWVNLADYASAPMLVGKVGGFNLSVSSGGLLTADYPSPSSASSIAVATGRWQHLAMTYDGGAVRLFVDGQPASSAMRTGPLGSSGSQLEIGRWNMNAQFLNGLIDEVRISNYARSNAQILDDATTMAIYRFDEGSGTSALDATGNGFTGTLVAGPTYGSGVTGKAITLDGASQYVRLPAGGNAAAGDYTVAIWFSMVAANGAGRSYLVDLRGDGASPTGSVALFVDGSTQVNSFVSYPGGAAYTQLLSTVGSVVGSWHHFATVRSGNTLTNYYDGAPIGGAVSGSAARSDTVDFSRGKRVGTWSLAGAPGNFWFNGALDGLRLYSRALTAMEIQSLFQSP